MKYKKVKATQYIPPYAIECANINKETLVKELKKRILNDMVDKYEDPYHNITFTLCCPEGSELTALVEEYKTKSGTYLYQGEFVSRERLEELLADKTYKLVMEAYVQI